jgi:hypothetical protein
LDTLAALLPDDDAADFEVGGSRARPGAAAAAADEDEEAQFAAMAAALAAHFAAPAEFARFVGATARSGAAGAAGLAAATLLCAEECRASLFFAAGGGAVLVSIAGWSGAPARVRATAVRALARATRFAAVCALLCNEWRITPGDDATASVAGVAHLLLAPMERQPDVARMATVAVLHAYVCQLSWQLRAAADAEGGDAVQSEHAAADAAYALASLLAQHRGDGEAAAFAVDTKTSPPQPSAEPTQCADILWLLLDSRALPSLAAAVANAAGDASARLRGGAAALLRELTTTRMGLYLLAVEASAAAALATALGGDSGTRVRAALLGVAGLEALQHGEGDAVRMGALHSLVRLTRDGAQRAHAALLLSDPAALDRLLDVLSAPHAPVVPGAPALAHALALELLVALVSDAAPASLEAWVPHASRLLQAVNAAEANLPPSAVAVARDWLAAGVRWQERGWAGLMSWLSALTTGGESAAAAAQTSADAANAAGALPGMNDAAAAPAAVQPGGMAALSVTGYVGALLALRLLSVAARASPDAAAALFGMDFFGVAALLLRRTAAVVASGGVAAADDAAAIEEDLDAGPALAATWRCVRAADVCASVADVVHAIVAHMHVGGITEYRAGALVSALRGAHAAAAVQHAAGGPAASAARSARRACAAALSFWATGSPAWQPRVLQAATGPPPTSPRATLAAALIIGDLLPPVGRPSRLAPGVRAQLEADLQPDALAALLLSAAGSPSVRLQAAAVRALARVAALAPGCVAAACVHVVDACSEEQQPVRRRVLRAIMLLAGDVDATDQGSLEAALRSRLSSVALGDDVEGDARAVPAVSVEHNFCAAVEDALDAGDSALVTWRLPREGIRASEDAAKRKRILRAEVRAKRTKQLGAAPPPPEPLAPPLAKRKHAGGGGGSSRTMHVDEFEARQAALKKGVAEEASAPPPPPPPPPPLASQAPLPAQPQQQAPMPAQAPAPVPAKSMLSIKFGASATAAPAVAPVVPAGVATADQPLRAAAPPEAAAQRPPSVQHQPLSAPAAAASASYAPQSTQAPMQATPGAYAAPPSVMPLIPGLGAYPAPAAIPGLGYAAVPPPAFAQHAPTPPAPPQPVQPPQPPRGPPPAASQASPPPWGQQQPAAPAYGQPRAPPAGGWDDLPDAAPYATAPPPPQQQPNALLLQQLASPEGISQLLNDPPRLRALLEQFPALASMLQQRLQAGAGGPQP